MQLKHKWSSQTIDELIKQEEIKLLIFDCDGTLMDTLKFHYKAWNDAYTELGYLFISEEEFLVNYAGTSGRELVMILNNKLNYDIDQSYISLIKNEIFINRYLTKVKPIKKVCDIVNCYYKKISMVVASGGQRLAVNTMLQVNNITHLFADIVTIEDVGNGKPHPDLFLQAAKNQAIINKYCLVFEDSEAGIIAANRAQMSCVDINLLRE